MSDRSKKSMLPYWCVLVMFNAAASFAHPVTPTLIVERSLDPSLFGTALAAMLMINFLFSPFWGKLCNYIPTKRIMLICACGYATGQIIFGAATTSAMVIGGRMFAGIFTGGMYVSFVNYVVNVSDDARRGRNLTTNVTIQLVSGAVGYFIGGFLGLISVEAAFIVQVITLVTSGILFLTLGVDDTPYKYKPEKSMTLREVNPFSAFAAAKQFMTPLLALIFIVFVIGGIGYSSFEQCFNYYIKDQFGMSSAYNGTFKAIIAFAILFANTCICVMLQRKTDINRSHMPILGIAAVILCLVPVINSKVYFVGSYVVFSALNSIRTALTQNMVASSIDPKNRNTGMGFYQAMNSLGSIFGALFAGLIYASNPMSPFILSAVAFVVCSLLSGLYVILYSKKKRFTKHV